MIHRPRHSLNVVTFDRGRRRTVTLRVREFEREGPRCRRFFTRNGSSRFFVGGLRGIRNSRESAVVFDVKCTQAGRRHTGGHPVSVLFKPLNGSNNRHQLGITVAHTGVGVGLIDSVLPSSVSLSHARSRNMGVLHSCVRFTVGNRMSLTSARGAVGPSSFTGTVTRFVAGRKCRMSRRVNYSNCGVSVTVRRPSSSVRRCVTKVRYSNLSCTSTQATESQSHLHKAILGGVK